MAPLPGWVSSAPDWDATLTVLWVTVGMPLPFARVVLPPVSARAHGLSGASSSPAMFFGHVGRSLFSANLAWPTSWEVSFLVSAFDPVGLMAYICRIVGVMRSSPSLRTM